MKITVVEINDFQKTKTVCPFPRRSPEAVAEGCRNIIQDKVVCDIGCAEGDTITFFAKYAKKVIGFEYDKKRYDHAVKRGLDVVIGDWFKDDLPDADVYYIWGPRPEAHFYVIEKLFKTKFNFTVLISGRKGAQHVAKCVERWNGEMLEFPFDETGDFLKLHDFKPTGIWWLGVLKNESNLNV